MTIQEEIKSFFTAFDLELIDVLNRDLDELSKLLKKIDKKERLDFLELEKIVTLKKKFLNLVKSNEYLFR